MTESSVPADSSGKRVLRKIARIPTPLIFLVCVLVALVVLWQQGQLQEMVKVMRGARLRPMLIAAPIYIASLSLLCLRWHLLVRMAQGWCDLPKASEAFLTSVVINYAAPVGLAVPSRAALTKRALGLDHHATGTIALCRKNNRFRQKNQFKFSSESITFRNRWCGNRRCGAFKTR